jgi:competence protein ComEC
MAISLAAQIFTLPICLYYFHQFPTWFLIANLVAVPLSTIILYVAIALVCLSWIPIVATKIGLLCQHLVIWMNQLISWMAHWPYSLIQNIQADAISTLILYITIICGLFAIHKQSKAALKVSLLIGCCYCGHFQIQTLLAQSQKKLVIYQVPKTTAIEVLIGTKGYFLEAVPLTDTSNIWQSTIAPAHLSMNIKEAKTTVIPSVHKAIHLYTIRGKRILLIKQKTGFSHNNIKLPIDYLIIAENPQLDFISLIENFKISLVIFDSSNSLWKIAKWQKQCDLLHLRHHTVATQGAFIADLP